VTSRFGALGDTVVLVESTHAVPIVSIVVSLRSGSGHDPLGRDGLTRIASRMLRRGCHGLSSTAIEDALDRLGSEMAVDTGVSTVAIFAQVIERNLDAFVDLFARLLSTPTFPQDELDRLERETVAEIVEARDNDRVVAQRAFQRTLFAGHPYGRSSGGTTTTVPTITRDDVAAFHRAHFVRGNIVIGFAGDVTAERAASLAERLVASLPAAAAQGDPVGEPSAQAGRRLVFVDKPERTQTQVLIGSLGTLPRDPDHTALGVANAVFGGTFTSRLMKAVRSERGWSYGAYARLSIDRHRQSFSMWTFPGAEDVAACIALELSLFEEYLAKGITAEELAFIQQYLVKSHAFEIDTASKRLHQALDVELLGLPSDYYGSQIARTRAVTLDAANEAVRARLTASDLLVVVVGTASESLEGVKGAIPSLASAATVPFDAE
jgi:zinc protease